MPATVTEKDTLNGFSAPRVITSDTQNERYISVLLEIERKASPTASEKNYAELLTLLIEEYEERQHPIREASPVGVLAELIAANNLRQKDLAPLLGSESVVFELLSGRRELNKNHIVKLSKRFNVSPALFF
jgi:HTH-type transcriptional regulator/antitoxin HigA